MTVKNVFIKEEAMKNLRFNKKKFFDNVGFPLIVGVLLALVLWYIAEHPEIYLLY
jgi:hypothetical protein